MAKLLCTLLLAGFVFQAYAFDVTTEQPDPSDVDWDLIRDIFDPVEFISNIGSLINPFNWVTSIPSVLNPLDWISHISDLLNPSELVSKIVSFINPLNYLPDISDLLNPVYWIKKIASFYNPFNWIPNFLNPFHYFPNLNPINWIPDVTQLIPNPFKFITGLVQNKCHIEPERGPCKARHQRYFYDKITKTCLTFEYGGCKGNRNNFQSKSECEKECRGH